MPGDEKENDATQELVDIAPAENADAEEAFAAISDESNFTVKPDDLGHDVENVEDDIDEMDEDDEEEIMEDSEEDDIDEEDSEELRAEAADSDIDDGLDDDHFDELPDEEEDEEGMDDEPYRRKDRGFGGRGKPMKRAQIEKAKEFFNTEILYRFDILENKERDSIKGKYRIELKGYNGGVWSLDLGNDIVINNKREDAEIVMSLKHADFLNIVNGKLNPQLAITAQKLKITGDIRKALEFNQILLP